MMIWSMDKDPNTLAALALRSTLARCVRAVVAQLEQEAKDRARLAEKVRERARVAGLVI